jgi:hypothetical protein
MLRSTKFLQAAGKAVRLLLCFLVVVSVCLLIPFTIPFSSSHAMDLGSRTGAASVGGLYPT